MNLRPIIQQVRDKVNSAFDTVDLWFNSKSEQLNYRPEDGGWTIAEILEHIALTNKFLLILIEKGAKKALKNVQERDFERLANDYQLLIEGLDEVALHNSFPWSRPEHMEPKGEMPLVELQNLLNVQLGQCLQILDQLPNGEGILYQTTMTVNDLGKLDVYQYLYFLAQHALRHCAQMQRNLELAKS